MCNLKGISSKIGKNHKSVNKADRNIIEILHHAVSFKLQIILTILSLLLLFHLLISLIVCRIPFSIACITWKPVISFTVLIG